MGSGLWFMMGWAYTGQVVDYEETWSIKNQRPNPAKCDPAKCAWSWWEIRAGVVLKGELRSKGPATDVIAILVTDAYPLKGYAEESVRAFQAHTGPELVHSDGLLAAVGGVAEAPLWNIALKDVIRTDV